MDDVVIVCHGTRQDHQIGQPETAPTRFARALQGFERRHVEGAGTRGTYLSRLAETVTGAGHRRRGLEALREWDASERPGLPGNGRLVVAGWSRGAITAVEFCRQVGELGAKVDFLALWDPVASYGLPGNSFDPGAPKEIPPCVKSCRIAYAADERNVFFRPKRFGGKFVESWWSDSDHSMGGPGRHPSILWMLDGARQAGIDVYERVPVTFYVTAKKKRLFGRKVGDPHYRSRQL